MLSFFATSRVSGLASIVTAIKFSKISAGAEPPFVKSLGGGSSPSAPSPPYSTPMRPCVSSIIPFHQNLFLFTCPKLFTYPINVNLFNPPIFRLFLCTDK